MRNKTSTLTDNSYPNLKRLCDDFDLSISNKGSRKEKQFCLYDKSQNVSLTPYFDTLVALEEHTGTYTVDILNDYLCFLSQSYPERPALYA